MRDTNKRPRVASTGELKTHKKKTEGEKGPSPAKGDVKEEDIQSDRDITTEIAAIAVKNEQLQESVASLKHKFSLRGEETHQLLLGLGALNAVANELETLQKDYQERSTKNAALVQESLTQISNCSAQVNTLKRCRGLTATQLQNFRHECAQEMTRLVNRLGDLADSTCQEPDPFDGDDVSCAAVQINNNRLQVERLKEEVCEYRTQFIQGELVASVPSLKSTVSPMKQETTQRINLALAQLDELHAEMFQLKQALMQENQSYRRHLENLVSRQMAHIREVQDNETERIHEEMDEIRSGMCVILKDMHRLKERTKYLVPSMARVRPRMPRSNPNGPPPLQAKVFGMSSANHKDKLWMNIPSANPQSTGYSMTMPSRQCQDIFPHYEHGYDDDCYCPGVMSTQMEPRYADPGRPRSSRSSNSSAGRSDDENWRMDVPASGQHTEQPFESPHYSSRSSSLSDRLSVFGEEHVVPNDEPNSEQFEQRLLEQHRQFWIGEGAG